MLASDIERNASVHVGALLSEHLRDDRIDAREHVGALHKPAGVVSAAADSRFETVLGLLPPRYGARDRQEGIEAV